MPNTTITLVFLFVPSLVSLFHLWNATYSLYSHGKSKTRIKKIGKSIKIWRKLLLLYPLETTTYYRTINILRKLYYFVVLVFLSCVLLLILSKVFPFLGHILFYCVTIKFFVLDLPIGIFAFIMTKHGKNGGVVWKWEN